MLNHYAAPPNSSTPNKMFYAFLCGMEAFQGRKGEPVTYQAFPSRGTEYQKAESKSHLCVLKRVNYYLVSNTDSN